MFTSAYKKDNDIWNFTVFAPLKESMKLKIISPDENEINMVKNEAGYFSVEYKCNSDEIDYFFVIDGETQLPDPASRYQPDGPHSFTRAVDYEGFTKSHVSDYRPVRFEDYIMYEVHIGTFSDEGTFDGFIKKIPYLKELGINAVEIMPVAQFPGDRNWGYDGTYPFAVQNSYGGPAEFKRLIDECHKVGIAVVLDVVYNHFGPEGNYFWSYGPYFTDKYKTPWGEAINFDGAYSNQVRDMFIENVIYWFKYFDIDALRFDAIHAIFDFSARHILSEIRGAVDDLMRETKRVYYMIAESDLNDNKVISDVKDRGYGFDGQWMDDFHHALHAFITGELKGFYSDFGSIEDIVKSYNEGYVHSGDYSKFRNRNHGNSSAGYTPDNFIVFSQNHDMIGNRMHGERLITLTSFEKAKLSAAVYLFSPYIPFIFMGEEYGETSPFCYFVSHTDKGLIEAVKKGRKEEFKDFVTDIEPFDPFAIETYDKSKLHGDLYKKDLHSGMFNLYRDIIAFRKQSSLYNGILRCDFTASLLSSDVIITELKEKLIVIYNFSEEEYIYQMKKHGKWKKLFSSESEVYSGKGDNNPEIVSSSDEITLKAYGFIVYKKMEA